MILHDVWNLELGFLPEKPIEIEPVQEYLSTDTGLLLFRQFDEQLGFTEDFAAQLNDVRSDPTHSILEMVRSRVFGILAGYEDQNDHDALRRDAIFKIIANRLPDDEDLASQPTLSRFENAVTPSDLLRLEDWFIQRFVDSFDEPPKEITLDIDVFDDPTHGAQQLTLFHGYYKQYQYLVRVITCAENDQVVLPVLLHGTAHASLGAAADIQRVVAALRGKFPDLRILVRADSGYAVPRFYQACEESFLEYTIGIGMNAVLKRESDALLQQAVAQYEESGQRQRLFTGSSYCFRMFLHCAASNLLVHLRRRTASPPVEPSVKVLTEQGADPLQVTHEIPTQACTGRTRRGQFNRRRRADPLGEGHACTWRTMLIKVAARIKITARRVRVFLSGSWPFLHFFRDVACDLANGT
jgi:hypothetical protein